MKKIKKAKHSMENPRRATGKVVARKIILPGNAAKKSPAASKSTAKASQLKKNAEAEYKHVLVEQVKVVKQSSNIIANSYTQSSDGKQQAGFDGFSGFADMLNDAGQLGANLGAAISDSMENFFVMAKNGALTVGQAAKMLGNALLKAALQSIAQAMLVQSIIDLGTGALLLLGIYTAGQGAEYLIAGGLEAAAAGIFFGLSAAYLAGGGLVTQPTLAVLGEGGQPELVLPQNKMTQANLGLNIQAQNFLVQFPDIKDPSIAQSPAFQRVFQTNLQAVIAGV